MTRDNLEEINRQIEEELLNDMEDKSKQKEKKKEFLGVKFWITFGILIIFLTKIITHIL